MTHLRTAFIALGSNLGDRDAQLDSATAAISALPGTRVLARSAVYETAPMGPAEFAFLNAAVAVETSLDPTALLEALLQIERDHGRVRDLKWGPRILDLDLLVMLDAQTLVAVQTPELTLPHPGITRRDFVLAPLHDLAPNLVLGGRSLPDWLASVPEADRTITLRRDPTVRSAG